MGSEKEEKIAQDSKKWWRNERNPKKGKNGAFCGFGALSSCRNKEEDDLRHFKTL